MPKVGKLIKHGVFVDVKVKVKKEKSPITDLQMFAFSTSSQCPSLTACTNTLSCHSNVPFVELLSAVSKPRIEAMSFFHCSITARQHNSIYYVILRLLGNIDNMENACLFLLNNENTDSAGLKYYKTTLVMYIKNINLVLLSISDLDSYCRLNTGTS